MLLRDAFNALVVNAVAASAKPRQVKGGLSHNTRPVFNKTLLSALIKSILAQNSEVLTIEVNGGHHKH